ncbi:MAG: hypothetical protein FJ095_06095 [Deltaproteobacteria bacterium]|nr:hypothetical protein [Deltaproteobacteria bacterium]
MSRPRLSLLTLALASSVGCAGAKPLPSSGPAPEYETPRGYVPDRAIDGAPPVATTPAGPPPTTIASASATPAPNAPPAPTP